MEVKLTKEEVVEAIKQYVGNKLNHDVASIDDRYISGASVELGKSKSEGITIDEINVKPNWYSHPAINPFTSPFTHGSTCTVDNSCNLTDLAPDIFTSKAPYEVDAIPSNENEEE